MQNGAAEGLSFQSNWTCALPCSFWLGKFSTVLLRQNTPPLGCRGKVLQRERVRESHPVLRSCLPCLANRLDIGSTMQYTLPLRREPTLQFLALLGIKLAGVWCGSSLNLLDFSGWVLAFAFHSMFGFSARISRKKRQKGRCLIQGMDFVMSLSNALGSKL